jgi:hypothetical protein
LLTRAAVACRRTKNDVYKNQTNPDLAGFLVNLAIATDKGAAGPAGALLAHGAVGGCRTERRLRSPNKPNARRNPRGFDHRSRQANPARLLAGGAGGSSALPAVGSPAAPRRIYGSLPTHFSGSTVYITHREVKAAAASRAAAKHAEDTAKVAS